jgi:hypothetical protein
MMDKDEAKELLTKKLAEYRCLSHADLIAKIGDNDCLDVTGPTGVEYQIDVQFVWDSEPGGDVRVMGGIDDGGKTYYSLMVGTNRLKSDDEIGGAAVKGFDAIKGQLDQLKKGESVFIHGRRLGEQAANEPAKAAANYCEKIGLKTQ